MERTARGNAPRECTLDLFTVSILITIRLGNQGEQQNHAKTVSIYLYKNSQVKQTEMLKFHNVL